MPDGAIEERETVEEAVTREVKEESNMKVLKKFFSGFKTFLRGKMLFLRQGLSVLYEPYGPFISDPDADITGIKLIDPLELKQYVDWGEIGDHLLERALKILRKMET